MCEKTIQRRIDWRRRARAGRARISELKAENERLRGELETFSANAIQRFKQLEEYNDRHRAQLAAAQARIEAVDTGLGEVVEMISNGRTVTADEANDMLERVIGRLMDVARAALAAPPAEQPESAALAQTPGGDR